MTRSTFLLLGACALATAVSLVMPSRQYRDGVPVHPQALAHFDTDGRLDLVYSFSVGEKTNALIYVDGKFVEKKDGQYLIHRFGNDTEIRVSPDQRTLVQDFDSDHRPDIGVYDNNLTLTDVYLGDGSGGFKRDPESRR